MNRERRRPAGSAAVLIAVVALLMLAGCSDSKKSATPTVEQAPSTKVTKPGPFFGECGQISLQELQQIVGVSDLTQASDNSSTCEWVSTSQPDAAFSFNWYRGSPIGRERANEQLSRDSVRNIKIGSGTGFITTHEGLTEVGVDFGGDFFEWSVRSSQSHPIDTESAVKTLAQRTVGRSTGAGDNPPTTITEGGAVKTDDYPQLLVECDRLDRSKLAETAGGSYAERTFGGAICRWLVGGVSAPVDVTFNWFEWNNMPTEKKATQRLGFDTENIKINGQAAFTQKNPKRPAGCGVTTNATSTGIFTFWVEPRTTAAAGDPCAAPTKLMELLLGNAL